LLRIAFAQLGRSPLANSDPGKAILDAKVRKLRAGAPIDYADPAAAAEKIIAERFIHDGRVVLRNWQGEFWRWIGSHYAQVPIADMRETVWRVGAERSPAPIKKRSVDDVVDALRALCNLSNDVPCPSWIAGGDGPPPGSLIPMQNGIFDLTARELRPASPTFFSTYSLPFAYDPTAHTPVRFLAFLAELWPDDEQSVALLQEWFGYAISPDTSQQKAMMFIGPKRGGKGTVGRVLTALLGRANVASPTLSSLGLPFGLQSLIGKQLALISDARVGHHADLSAIAENLLRISGEDLVSVPRKFLPDYTATLGVRFMLFSNEAPRLIDGSGALPSRFLVLSSTVSFYGREDHELTRKLLAELPGIFIWALAGLERLRARGHFMQPESSSEIVEELETLAAPMQSFLAEECETGDPAAEVLVQELFAAWQRWCGRNGREHPGTRHTFGRDLRSALPRLRVRQPRVDGRQERAYVGLRLRGDTR
jgi:putative DNA primase/helicase